MKATLTSLLLVLLMLPTTAQIQYLDFDGPQDDAEVTLEIDWQNSDMDYWQIGTPMKLGFDTAYSAPNAIMTDLNEPYGVNMRKSFIIRISPNSFGWVGLAQLSFWHRMHSTSGRDGGYIEVRNQHIEAGCSPDWRQLYTTDGWWAVEPDCQLNTDLEGFPSVEDTLFDGTPGFSGYDTTWRQSTFDIYCIAVKTHGKTDYEPLEFRFTFISDSIPEDNAGWILDNFHVHMEGGCSDVGEVHIGESLTVSPNPASDLAYFYLEATNLIRNATFEIYDLTGALAYQEKGIHQNSFTIDLQSFPSGCYLYQLHDEERQYGGGRLLVD